MQQQITEEGLVLIPFENILTALLGGQTVFVRTEEGLLSLKFTITTGELLGCTLDKENNYVLENFKPIDLKLSELLCGSDLNWYRYMTFNKLEDT